MLLQLLLLRHLLLQLLDDVYVGPWLALRACDEPLALHLVHGCLDELDLQIRHDGKRIWEGVTHANLWLPFINLLKECRY